MYEGLARVITFVTWRYVALRPFTLRRDAPLGSRSRPARLEKRAAPGRKEKRRRGRKVLSTKRRNEERRGGGTGEGRKDGKREARRTESPRVFCFAAFLRNFYDYRLSGSPSARIGLLGPTWPREGRTTCGFTTFTVKRLLAAILVTVSPEPHPSFITASVFRSYSSSPPWFYVFPNILARPFLCSRVNRVQIRAIFGLR